MQDKVRVVLYTKPGCGLCDEMKSEMQNAEVNDLYILEEVNIETDPELYARYRYVIPIVYINGVEAFRHRLDRRQFKALLRTGHVQ